MTLKDIVALFRHNKIAAPLPSDLVIMAGMQERNEARMKTIKEEMGEKYILHPSHMKSRLDAPRPV